MEQIISVLTDGPICCRNCCSQWQTLVKICTNRASIYEYKIAHWSFLCDNAEQSIEVDEFRMIWWMNLPFIWRFLFYFSFCCVCICMSKRAERTVAWVRSIQQECIVPSTGHAECPKLQTGIFVERKAPENFCGPSSPISNPEKNRLRTKVSYFFPNL